LVGGRGEKKLPTPSPGIGSGIMRITGKKPGKPRLNEGQENHSNRAKHERREISPENNGENNGKQEYSEK